METALLEAARDGNVEIFLKLVKDDHLVLERIAPSSAETPLHIAALLGNFDLVKEIIKHKRQVVEYASELNPDGFSPLHMASANGHIEVVRLLLEVSHELCSVQGREGKTPLHCAASKGRAMAVSELLVASPLSIQLLTERNETALHLAAKNNQTEALGNLVEGLQQLNMEEILNWKDEEGNAVLHLAASRKNRRAIEILLKRQTESPDLLKVNAMNEKGLTALDLLQLLPYDSCSRGLERLLESAGAVRVEALNSLLPRPPPPQPSQQASANDATATSTSGSNHRPRRVKSPWEDYFKFKLGRDTPGEIRTALLAVAMLMVNATYQAVLSPPGGVWQDGPRRGQAHLATSKPISFITFMVCNSAGFFVSQTIILILTTNFPFYYEMVLALATMDITYDTAMIAISSPGAMSTFFSALSMFMPISIILMSIYTRKWYRAYLRHRGRPEVYVGFGNP